MPRLTENQRLRAIGMLQAGLAQSIVARHFGVHRKSKRSLLRRFGPLEQPGFTFYVSLTFKKPHLQNKFVIVINFVYYVSLCHSATPFLFMYM
jgi:hypothetical protein